MKILKPFGTQSFVIGVGIAALSYLFGPTIKKGAREVTVKGMQGALLAGEAASNAVDEGKKKMSNVINNMKKPMDKNEGIELKNSHIVQQLVNELQAERQQNREMFESLMNTVKDLQNEMSSLKEDNDIEEDNELN
ncbi:hypothetical protein [Caldisalinibacter kiritimatiensis]|uniref:Uncharacterized protein n=1 Tax=Caldisalinibacter kiritimatiensis TaxID=1304284 RepID=R1ASA1_9FIRM|nr:hypothetical protein [Caldisalinibacter kiritimatiensis]EOC99521.1 hypothetical protein L21TH_2433 [Caldisalinibacter kiritimatiensis]